MYRDESSAASERVVALEREVKQLKAGLVELRRALEVAERERDEARMALERALMAPPLHKAKAVSKPKGGRAAIYCPACGAGNERNALGCTRCGETLWHHRRNTPRCPACRDQPLQQREVDWECVRCGGRWVAAQHFRRLVETARAGRALPTEVQEDAPRMASVRRRATSCPRCGQIAQRRPYGEAKVVVDICPERHGIFFDAGELMQVLRWEGSRPGRGGPDPLAD